MFRMCAITGFLLVVSSFAVGANPQPPAVRLGNESHYDEIKPKLPASVDTDYAAMLPFVAAAASCSQEGERDAQSFFAPKLEHVVGGPRQLASAVEEIHLCAAAKPSAEKQISTFLQQYGSSQTAGGK